MAASDSSHHKRFQGYHGLRINPAEWADVQQGSYDAATRMQRRFVSPLARVGQVAGHSLLGDFVVSVSPNFGLDPNGLGVDWESALSFDAKTATHGIAVGDTTPNPAEKSYVILAVANLDVPDDPRTDSFGAEVFYELKSTTQARVYQLVVGFPLADVWYLNPVLEASLLAVVADDATPFMILERRDGTSDFAAGDVHPVENVMYEAGDPQEERDEVREVLGFSLFPTVLNETGTAAAVGVAVPAAPGQVSVTGGERVLISVRELGPSGGFRRLRARVVTIPATVLDLDAASTSYVARMKLDLETGEPDVYFGEGSFALDSYPGHFGFSGQGDAAVGYRRTLVDMPLFTVTTGALGDAPVVLPIENSAEPAAGVGSFHTLVANLILGSTVTAVTSINAPNAAKAWAKVDVDGGLVYLGQFGFTGSPVAVGGSIFNLSLASPLVSNDAAVLVTVDHNPGFAIGFMSDPSTVRVVVFNSSGSASDLDFNVVVYGLTS